MKKILKRVSFLLGMCLLSGIINLQAATLTVSTTVAEEIGAYKTQYPTPITVSVGGRILASDSRIKCGVSGAFVYLTDINGHVRVESTTSSGYYNFKDVPVDETYIISVEHKRFNFAPQVVRVFEEMTQLNLFAL